MPGNNIVLTDLFDVDHVRKVLAAFGRAFVKLPDQISQTTNEQKVFIRHAVADLAETGKVNRLVQWRRRSVVGRLLSDVSIQAFCGGGAQADKCFGRVRHTR